MILTELLATYRPESHGGTRGETWAEHAAYLLNLDVGYMARLEAHMLGVGGWIDGPAVVDDWVVQDGHHRIVIAMRLNWHDLYVPIEAAKR